LRSSLVPSLLSSVGINASRGNVDLELFEIARTYEGSTETIKAGIALAGQRRATWSREGRDYTLYDMKGLIEMLAAEARETGCIFEACDAALFVPGTGTAVSLHGKVAARFGEVTDTVRRNSGIKTKGPVFVAEIMLDEWVGSVSVHRRFAPIISLPVVVRDVSVVVEPPATFERIEALIRSKAPEVVRSVSLADTYIGKEIPAGKIAFTVSVTYGRPDRTLTDEEVNGIHQGILEDLRRDLGVTLR
jgi:phenylalanyl-tRNA synthetase beta chain